MGKGPTDRLADQLLHGGDDLRSQGTPDRNTAKGNGMAGDSLPPLAQILNQGQPMLRVGETALVDDHPGVHLAGCHSRHDPVKPHGDQIGTVGGKETEQHGSGGVLARNRHPFTGKLLTALRAGCHQQWATAPTQSATAVKEHIVIKHMSEGVEGELGDIEPPLHGPAVEGLHILQHLGGETEGSPCPTWPCIKAWKIKVSLGQGE